MSASGIERAVPEDAADFTGVEVGSRSVGEGGRSLPLWDSRARLFLTALALFALVACGGKFSSGSAEAYGTFRIDVTNDRAPRVEVALVPDGGEATALGVAPVEGTTTYRVEPDDPSATYRLRATLTGGRELTSESFVPAELRGVTWVLSSNTLTREGADE